MAIETGRITINETAIIELDSSPLTGGGFDSPVGALAVNKNDGNMFRKETLSPTGWQQFSINLHAARHLPSGADPLETASGVTVSTNGSNSEGNAESFARSNHTHKVEILSATVKANNSVTTTSGTDVLLTGMTATPPAGTYKIMAHASALLSQNTDMFFSVYVGGVQVTASQGQRTRSNNNTANQRMDWNYFDDVTVNGSQAIEIRWRRTAGTATAFDRQLSYMRVS